MKGLFKIVILFLLISYINCLQIKFAYNFKNPNTGFKKIKLISVCDDVPDTYINGAAYGNEYFTCKKGNTGIIECYLRPFRSILEGNNSSERYCTHFDGKYKNLSVYG